MENRAQVAIRAALADLKTAYNEANPGCEEKVETTFEYVAQEQALRKIFQDSLGEDEGEPRVVAMYEASRRNTDEDVLDYAEPGQTPPSSPTPTFTGKGKAARRQKTPSDVTESESEEDRMSDVLEGSSKDVVKRKGKKASEKMDVDKEVPKVADKGVPKDTSGGEGEKAPEQGSGEGTAE